jgi:pimeloyl-ACP methyl ester carboxylesterase
MTRFTEALGLSHYTLYMQDYGGPVGFRKALAHPERVEALIVQNAVAHNEGLGPLWNSGERFGPTGQPMRTAFAPIFCHSKRRERVMSGVIPMWIAMIPICGSMNLRSSVNPPKPTFKATCSTMTAPISMPTPSGRIGCVTGNRACWWSRASMIPRSISRSRKPIAGMCRRPKSTFLTLATSHWTRPRMRSPH